MPRSTDMTQNATGGQGTVSGKTRGSKGVTGIASGAGGAPSTGKRAPGSVGWPGAMDSRSTNDDRTQSAK